MFLTGSKVGLGTPWRRIRDLFGPPLGLESCWGFAVSHASRCRGCDNSVCIGFERWMKHIPAEAQVLVFLTGSKVGLGTPWRRIRDLFGPPLGLESCWGFAVSHASRCRGCGNSVCIGFERWMKHTSRGSGPIVFLTGSKVGLGTPWRPIRDVFEPPLGLESCWGFAVSHASSTPCSRGPDVQANRGRSCHSLAVHCTAAEGAVKVSV